MNTETLIILMGSAYAAIEAVQLILLIRQSKRTADALDRLLDPESEEAGVIATNFFVGMSKRIRADPQAQQAFGELVAWMGACAFQQAQKSLQNGVKMPKIKSIGDLLGLAFQMPGIQAAVEKKAAQIAGLAEEAGAAEVVKDTAWGL